MGAVTTVGGCVSSNGATGLGLGPLKGRFVPCQDRERDLSDIHLTDKVLVLPHNLNLVCCNDKYSKPFIGV